MAEGYPDGDARERPSLKMDGTESNATVQFSMMDDSDGSSDDDKDGGEEDTEEQNKNRRISADRSARLSFMFEHNTLINVRLNALAADLRNGNLLSPEELRDCNAPQEKEPKRHRRASAGKLSTDSKLSTGTLQSADGSSTKEAPKAKARKNLLVPDGGPRRGSSSSSRVAISRQVSPVQKSPQRGAVDGSDGVVLDELKALKQELKDFKLAGEEEKTGKLVKEISELRADLAKEQSSAKEKSEENAGLRQDLRQCKAVISRLMEELNHATKQIAQQKKQAKQTQGSQKEDAPDEEDGFLTDLQGAIGSFFGGLGQSKPRPTREIRINQDRLQPASESSESFTSDDDSGADDAPFTWANVCGKSIQIADDGLTATHVGKVQDGERELYGYVVTAEPPLLEADQGYGFEITIKTVSSGSQDGLSIGFTETAPSQLPPDLPETADCINGTFLVGFGGEMFVGRRAADGSEGSWTDCKWNPSTLQPGDRVGIQVSQDGDLFIIVNTEMVQKTNIGYRLDSGKPLYGIVDLLGNTDAVVLVDE